VKFHHPDNVYDLQKILVQLVRSKKKARTESVVLSNALMHDIVSRLIELENKVEALEANND
jgi:ribosomal protein S17